MSRINEYALSRAWFIMDHLFQHEDFTLEDFREALEAYEKAKEDQEFSRNTRETEKREEAWLKAKRAEDRVRDLWG